MREPGLEAAAEAGRGGSGAGSRAEAERTRLVGTGCEVRQREKNPAAFSGCVWPRSWDEQQTGFLTRRRREAEGGGGRREVALLPVRCLRAQPWGSPIRSCRYPWRTQREARTGAVNSRGH